MKASLKTQLKNANTKIKKLQNEVNAKNNHIKNLQALLAAII